MAFIEWITAIAAAIIPIAALRFPLHGSGQDAGTSRPPRTPKPGAEPDEGLKKNDGPVMDSIDPESTKGNSSSIR